MAATSTASRSPSGTNGRPGLNETETASGAGVRAHRLGMFARGPLRGTAMRIGLIIVGFFSLVAVFGPLIVTTDPMEFSAEKLQPPSSAHWLGTTLTGQDVFAQVIDGARATMLLGLIVGIFATTLAIGVGLTSAYFGGWIDEVLSVITNIFLVMPALPLAIVLAGYSPVKGPVPLVIVITITGWAWGARVVRAQTLSLRKRDFVEAARSSGESAFRIMFFEILPNEIAIAMSSLIFTIIAAILADVGLEYVGLGDVTLDSWGNMLFWAGNTDALLLGAWWWIVPPGLCIALLGAGLALINFGIDEITNPRLRNTNRR